MKQAFFRWSVISFFISLIFFILMGQFYFDEIKSYWSTRLGIQALQSENFSQAFEKFSEALSTKSEFSPYHLNLGLSQQLLKREEEAEKSFQYAEKNAQEPEVQFYALFNLAVLATQLKKFDKGLEYYQSALNIDPNSEPVKINIELLVQKQQQDQQQKQDQSDQKDGQGGEGQQDQKDPQDQKDEQKEQPKNYAQPQKQKQKQKFESKDLHEADVKKILGELERQEQKIRREYNKQNVKERPNAKDW